MIGLYVAVSGYSLGHTARTAAIIAYLQERLPELVITISASTPEWLGKS